MAVLKKKHRLLDETNGIHQIHNWETDDLDSISVTDDDIGKVAELADGDALRFYVLVGTSPTEEGFSGVWRELARADVGPIQSYVVADANELSVLPVTGDDLGKVAYMSTTQEFYVMAVPPFGFSIAGWNRIDNVPYGAGVPSSIGTSNLQGASSAPARSDHVHDGTTLLTSTAPVAVTAAAAVIGVSQAAARADHRHTVTTAAPSGGIGSANAAGSSTSLARADHVHDASSKADAVFTLVNITTGTTQTLTAAQAGQLLAVNVAVPYAIVVPPNSSVAIAIGATYTTIQRGTGQLTISPGAGVTFECALTPKTRTQFSPITMIKVATDTWSVSGDLAVT